MDTEQKEYFGGLTSKGMSLGDAAKTLDAPGGSKTSLWRILTAEKKDRLELLSTRRFDDVPIVAAFLDGTWVGRRRRKRLVMVVIGVAADGQKFALGAEILKSEKGDAVYSMLTRIADRGVDRGILWIADQGVGIRRGLNDLRPAELWFQHCTTHAVRNVIRHLKKQGMDKTLREEFRGRIWEALRSEDAEIAKERLDKVVAELNELRYEPAADSLEGSAPDIITVQKLGLTGDTLKALRSTNPQEGTNGKLKAKGPIPLQTNYRDSKKLLRDVAWRLIDLKRNSWNRVADPVQLVGLMKRLGLDRRDPEGILASLPPHLLVDRLPVLEGEDEEAQKLADKEIREFADKWHVDHPGARWIGPNANLKDFGLIDKSKKPVALTSALLVEAMRGHGPGGTVLRPPGDIEFPSEDTEGNWEKRTAKGIFNLRWEMTVSPSAMAEWRKGGQASERVEKSLEEAALTALQHVTLTDLGHHSVVGVADLVRPSVDDPEQVLSIVGIVFAKRMGRATSFRDPAVEGTFESARIRKAEDMAKAVLDGAVKEVVLAPQPEVRTSHAIDFTPSSPGPAPIEAVREWAFELAPDMVGADIQALKTRARGLDATEDALGTVARDIDEWWETSSAEAARRLAAEVLWPASRTGQPRDVWGQLDRGLQVTLGEERAQLLLGEVAAQVGRAEGDVAEARRLRDLGDESLAGLRRVAAQVKTAAEALAADHELDRRQRFEAARVENGVGAPTPPAIRDSRGVLAVTPLQRHHKVLGSRRTEVLWRYAAALADDVRALDDAALARLADDTKEAWGEIEVSAGRRLLDLETLRDETLAEGLKFQRRFGREAAIAKRAEDDKDEEVFKADRIAQAAKIDAHGSWEQLRLLEDQVEATRRAPGSPASLVRDGAAAAVFQAAFAELSRRERERESPSRRQDDRGKGVTSLNSVGMADDKRINAGPNQADDARAPGPGLERLRDSLSTHGPKLGGEKALRIKERADGLIQDHGLTWMTDKELRQGLPTRDPFASLPEHGNLEALRGWWGENIRDAARVVAVERVRIDRQVGFLKDVAKLETERRGRGGEWADSVTKVQEARGERYAAKVARRAAVRAGALQSLSAEKQDERSAAVAREIREATRKHGDKAENGFKHASFDATVEAVALQHLRNLRNQEMARNIATPAPDLDTGRQDKAPTTTDIDVGV